MGTSNNKAFDSESNFTHTMKAHLIEMAKWAKFISIVWFGFLFVFLVFSLNYLLPALKGLFTYTQSPILGILYLVITLLLALPNFKLLQFSTEILKNIPLMNHEGIETGLSRMKFVFKFYGILFIICLVVLLLLATKTFHCI
jgi:fumarate reductase subunit C